MRSVSSIIPEAEKNFSIITVCRNAEKTIERTIDSVLKKNKIDNLSVEYIIIDGASSDGTLDIVRSKDDIIYISEQDDGVYDAMNKGIKLATGKYIGIINADDWYEPKILLDIKKLFDDENIDVIHGNMRVFSGDNEIRMMRPSKAKWRKYIGMPINHPTMFVKSQVYKTIGLYNTNYKIAADYDVYLRMLRNQINVFYLDKVIANFRLGGLSSQKLAFKESVKVRTENGIPLIIAILSVSLIQLVKYTRVLLVRGNSD